MKSIELAKAYDPKTFEDRIYSLWKNSGAFQPKGEGDPSSALQPFVIVIPPPNVTGVLHLGHGLNNSLQDIIVRFHRMRGVPTLWVPGTDHAGIATQHVVERKLKERGTSRRELGREKFLEETWKVKDEHHAIITKQLEKIGASADWSRERFTMDEGLSHAVREVFVSLYERNLLYKGNYLVNWCTTCGTALADDEVDREEIKGKMYHIKYFYSDDSSKFIEVATTRPETMLGDTAVAFHPEDERYAALKGKTLRLPLTDRDIPVVYDTYVDKDFGTGAVKITPAHDPNDWEVAKRHNLEVINILNADGTLNENVPEKYQGLSVKKAREEVVNDLKEQGFFVKEEDITHAVGHCYRCNTVIEPYLSEQWFVKMKPLADKALACWQRGEIVFYPKKWENTYRHWMENIRDWCISRQLWWGHRIPAWTCQDCTKLSVSREDLKECPECKSPNIEQDPDVLDTWFSSWLWPFSTLGWCGSEDSISDFARYYPTTALITAYDIIFFWVARMIMAGLEFTGKAPFRDIYIHSLVRDKLGRKMSKSLGNGIDPLELVDEYGSDAMKFTLAFMCAQGQDVLVDKDSFKLGSKFANKIWNASRYILMNLDGRKIIENPKLSNVDKWIYSRFNSAVKTIREAFFSYRYNDAASAAYEFFWNDFCDWYVEATKLSTKGDDDAEKDRITTVLLDVLEKSLRMLHPLLPFVTEEIYQQLRGTREKGEGKREPCSEVNNESNNTENTNNAPLSCVPCPVSPSLSPMLITAPYPEYDEKLSCPEEEKNFSLLQSMVTMVRTLRSECNIQPHVKLKALARCEQAEIFEQNSDLIKLLTGIADLQIEALLPTPYSLLPGTIGLAGQNFEVFVHIKEAVDTKALKKKFTLELEKDKKYMENLVQKLANENFVKNAPIELVEEQKTKLEETKKRTEKIAGYLKDL